MLNEEESGKIKTEILFVIGKYESLVLLIIKVPYVSEGRPLTIVVYGGH